MIIDAMKLRLALVRQCKGNKEFAKEAGICEGTITKLCRRYIRSTCSKSLGGRPFPALG